MKSKQSKENTSVKESGHQICGALSTDLMSPPPHLPMLNEITSTDLNKAELSKFGELSSKMRHEHRAHQAVMNSLATQSLAKGFKNIAVIRRPDVLIKLLIEEGILPDESNIGRQKFMGVGYLERTALAAPIAFLEERQERIKEWVEDNTRHFPDDVYNVLIAGSVLGATLGFVEMSSNSLSTLYSRMRALPDTACKTKVLRDKDRMLRLINAD